MSKLIARAQAISSATGTRIGFETEGGGDWPVWDRYLTLDGKRAHHIGNICGTCRFIFERKSGANDKVSPSFADELRVGINELTSEMLEGISSFLPAGPYEATLLEVTPSLVSPCSPLDYFCCEQVELWGMDGFWGLPHDPRNEYYRPPVQPLEGGKGLFEFIVPMFPSRWLHEETIKTYKTILGKREKPTALAVSVLDIKSPASWGNHPPHEFSEHWCWAHYLLDGHHKMFTASQVRKPISLLSFTAVDKGISSSEQVGSLISALLRR